MRITLPAEVVELIRRTEDEPNWQNKYGLKKSKMFPAKGQVNTNPELDNFAKFLISRDGSVLYDEIISKFPKADQDTIEAAADTLLGKRARVVQRIRLFREMDHDDANGRQVVEQTDYINVWAPPGLLLLPYKCTVPESDWKTLHLDELKELLRPVCLSGHLSLPCDAKTGGVKMGYGIERAMRVTLIRSTGSKERQCHHTIVNKILYTNAFSAPTLQFFAHLPPSWYPAGPSSKPVPMREEKVLIIWQFKDGRNVCSAKGDRLAAR